MLCFNYGITMNLSQTGCIDEVLAANNNNNNSNPRFVFIFLQTMRSMRDYMVTDIFDGWGILLPAVLLKTYSLVRFFMARNVPLWMYFRLQLEIYLKHNQK